MQTSFRHAETCMLRGFHAHTGRYSCKHVGNSKNKIYYCTTWRGEQRCVGRDGDDETLSKVCSFAGEAELTIGAVTGPLTLDWEENYTLKSPCRVASRQLVALFYLHHRDFARLGPRPGHQSRRAFADKINGKCLILKFILSGG